MPLYALGELQPTIHPTAFVHPDAVVIGNVTIGANSSVWPTSVLRGDRGAITVGERTSIQDGSIIHTTAERSTIIGNDVVIGHNVHAEGCTIGNHSLIGSGSVVLNGVTVGDNAMVAAGAVVSPGLEIPPGALAIGVPARIKAVAAPQHVIDHSVKMYVENAAWYLKDLRRIDG